MNLVGKIFVVLIFVLSLALMTLTVSVYMTHTNWRLMVDNTDTSKGYPKGLKQQMEDLKKENQDLRSAYAILVGNYEVAFQKSTNAETEVKVVKDEQNTKVDELKKSIDTSYADTESRLDLTHQALVTIVSGHSLLCEAIKGLQREITDISDRLADKTDYMNQIVQLERRNKELEARNDDLKNENVRANEILTYNNMINDLDFYRTQAPPNGVQGRVLEQAGRKIVINIGSDDGVRIGHKFQLLSRDGSAYLCDVEVEQITPDTATCAFSNLRSEQSINVIPGCIVKPL